MFVCNYNYRGKCKKVFTCPFVSFPPTPQELNKSPSKQSSTSVVVMHSNAMPGPTRPTCSYASGYTVNVPNW